MPFIQRGIEPVNVSHVEVDKSVANELECVTNHTLSSVIQQLSSLSHHAEDMFEDLSKEASNFFGRANQLQNRIDHLRDKVKQLDAEREQGQQYQNLYNRHILNVQDLLLEKLNEKREDGKDSMKFYTDPGYFFELWFSDIQKDIEQKKTEYKAKRKKQRPKETKTRAKPKEIKLIKEKYKDRAQGIEFSSEYQNPQQILKGLPSNATSLSSADIQNKPIQNHISSPQQQNDIDPRYSQAHANKKSQYMNGPNELPSPQDPRITQMSQQHQQYYDPSIPDHPQQHPGHLHLQQHHQRGSRAPSMISPARPQQAPPPPPPFDPNSDRMRGQRDSLPPPPPPPPLDADSYNHKSYTPSPQMTRNQQMNYEIRGESPQGGSPVRQPSSYSSSPSRRTPDHLPPPPPPPQFITMPETPIEIMPPPPISPPPMDGGAPPPRLLLPPSSATTPPQSMPNGHVRAPSDGVSISSTNSSSTIGRTEIEQPPAPVETERSALLSEIRIGDCKYS
ncbi:Wiskott-Aldrich syndrome protein family member 3 [Mytilus coruscus]|uniref:Wiskott-Aldrich syndrome protein family member 3 n=1 Tax=Mytilus coruscus TaxID=42192 RepID=A0A6J8DH77_MYTCO|nr:Wiskott-Aldrich syndrome protein family member 3 [Mytilus coruscus]